MSLDLWITKSFDMPYFKTKDDTQLHYSDWGTGQPLLFVHALAMDLSFWDYTIPFFTAQGYRCIAYDQRGHGKSDEPGKGYDLDTLASDMHSLIKHLDLADVTLIGHSIGGMEIIRYHTLFAQEGLVSKLVFIGSPDCLMQQTDHPMGLTPELLEMGLAKIADDYPNWWEENIDAFYLPEVYQVSEGIKSWTRMIMFQTRLGIILDLNRKVFHTDARKEVAQIKLPTMVMHGDKDASIPFWCGESIAAAIPGSVFKAYPGAPHGMIISIKSQINRDLLEFITASFGSVPVVVGDNFEKKTNANKHPRLERHPQ